MGGPQYSARADLARGFHRDALPLLLVGVHPVEAVEGHAHGVLEAVVDSRQRLIPEGAHQQICNHTSAQLQPNAPSVHTQTRQSAIPPHEQPRPSGSRSDAAGRARKKGWFRGATRGAQLISKLLPVGLVRRRPDTIDLLQPGESTRARVSPAARFVDASWEARAGGDGTFAMMARGTCQPHPLRILDSKLRSGSFSTAPRSHGGISASAGVITGTCAIRRGDTGGGVGCKLLVKRTRKAGWLAGGPAHLDKIELVIEHDRVDRALGEALVWFVGIRTRSLGGAPAPQCAMHDWQ